MKNIILTGYMGTGKTTISKEISKLAKMKLADTDKMVEESEGVSIKEIFSSCSSSGYPNSSIFSLYVLEKIRFLK